MMVTVAEGQGLEVAELERVAARLRAKGIEAVTDFPGILRFEALGRSWATGYTGLHVHSDDGHADAWPDAAGEDRLVSFEGSTFALADYAAALVATIERVAA